MNYFRFSDQNNYTLETVSQFNDKCFAIRAPNKAYDTYRFVKNPFSDKSFDFLYGVETEGKYIAQMLTTPGALTYNEKITPVFWGQDYIVLEEYRGSGIGKELSNFYLKKEYYIAVGFSEKSAVIHQKMGARKIAYLDYFEKWGNELLKIKFLTQRLLKIKPKLIESYSFPKKIENFELISSVNQLQLINNNWNSNTIETIRNKEFIAWRFFEKPNRYFVYHAKPQESNQNSIYFVVKPYFYKGVNWLRVVDYRYKIEDKNEFECILNAIEFIRKKLNLYGVLISSSLKKSNVCLKNNKFKQTNHQVVLTTYPFQHQETEDEHNHFMISFADSDLDMHSNLGEFNYK